MQQKWWIFAAGGVGIVLAILLFPRPNTGESVPPPDPTNTQPLNFKEEPQRQRLSRKDPKSLKARDIREVPEEGRRGPNPYAKALAERRNTPEALYAGRTTGPWTIIRRQLLLMNDPEAEQLVEDLQTLVLDLRAQRRDPDQSSWRELIQLQENYLATLQENDAWLADETIKISLQRVDDYLKEYAEAAEAAETPQDRKD